MTNATGDTNATSGIFPVPTVVVMAKMAVAGRVKTRLAKTFGESEALAVYRAMRACLLRRLEAALRDTAVTCVLAVDGAQGRQAAADRVELAAEFAGYRIVEQGEGDLGERLERVWRAVGGGPVVFLGTDSPDVPADLWRRAIAALAEADVAIGPAGDGGYWTLAARRLTPHLLRGIDWGTDRVYHQTLMRASEAGLPVAVLPLWHDVDEPADLLALRQRLADSPDPLLRQLQRDLEQVPCSGSDGMTDPVDAPVVAAPNAPATALSPQEQEALAQSTILVVDDNVQNVELLVAYLEVLPCRVVTANDGIEALALVNAKDKLLPDLILLDVMMPKMSGFEVCRKLKEDPRTRAIPVMMVTALNELGDIERGVEAGTDDFLTKPVNKLELITRVKSLLRVRHLKRELDRTMAYIQDMRPQDKPNDPSKA